MRNLFIAIFGVCLAFMTGCGSDKSGVGDRWNLSENPDSSGYGPEAWWEAGQRRSLAGKCDDQRKPPLWLKVPLAPVRSALDIGRSEIWISAGGGFAEPTRHWFQCPPDWSAFAIDGQIGGACMDGDFYFGYRHPTHPSGLPPWVLSEVEWWRAGEWENGAYPTIGVFDIPFRIYEPRSARLLEVRMRYRVHSQSFTIETLLRDSEVSEGYVPDGLTCMNEMRHRTRSVIEITEICGRETNCSLTELDL